MKRTIRATATLLCTLAAVNAQQMTINSATQTYEKRLAAANQVRTAEAAKVNAAYEESLRRLNAEYSIRVQGALRSATDEDTATLQKMLASLAPPVSTTVTVTPTTTGGTVSTFEFDKIFDTLVGTWNGKKQTVYSSSSSGSSSSNQVEYTYIDSFEFKNPKTLIRSQKRTYAGGSNSESRLGEHKARLRDGKIVFETVASNIYSPTRTYSEWYEIPIPFDLDNLEIVYCYERPGQIRESSIKLTRAKK